MSHGLHPSAAALRTHERACERGEAGYMDPDSGLFVMASLHLANQGVCCGNGCRHCPWPQEAQARAGRPGLPCYAYPGGVEGVLRAAKAR